MTNTCEHEWIDKEIELPSTLCRKCGKHFQVWKAQQDLFSWFEGEVKDTCEAECYDTTLASDCQVCQVRDFIMIKLAQKKKAIMIDSNGREF